MTKISGLLDGKPMSEWIERYEEGHRNPVNRGFHLIGIPLIALSLPLFLISPFIPRFWRVPAALFALGWVFQFAGHAVEGKPPEFFKDPRFLLVGLRWWISRVIARP